MSLSQKYPGYQMVPWFNRAEWNYVYKAIYSDARNEQLKGLEVLKIWKQRSPNLPVGVEGTLLVLDALIEDRSHLSEEDRCKIYALHLMRFLNLSAGNNQKQGFFEASSFKNEIPKWIVDLRHDIAHGYQLPSSSNVQMALLFSFNWLKQKYWMKQNEVIPDFKPIRTYNKKENFAKIIKSYGALAFALYESNKIDRVFLRNIKTTIKNVSGKQVSTPYGCIDTLEGLLKEYLSKCNGTIIRDCVNYLASPFILLRFYIETDHDIRINKGFRNLWKTLLNILNNNSLLNFLIDGLFNATWNVSYSDNHKIMAALWINEIIVSLQNLKEKNLAAEDSIDYLGFDSKQFLYNVEIKKFQTKIISTPNRYAKYFMVNLLKYNESTEFSIEKFRFLTDCFFNNQHLKKLPKIIYTKNDLIHLKSNFSMSEPKDCESNEENFKFKLLEDTSAFHNCPIGVLPNQLNQVHPFLPIKEQ